MIDGTLVYVIFAFVAIDTIEAASIIFLMLRQQRGFQRLDDLHGADARVSAEVERLYDLLNNARTEFGKFAEGITRRLDQQHLDNLETQAYLRGYQNRQDKLFVALETRSYGRKEDE